MEIFLCQKLLRRDSWKTHSYFALVVPFLRAQSISCVVDLETKQMDRRQKSLHLLPCMGQLSSTGLPLPNRIKKAPNLSQLSSVQLRDINRPEFSNSWV